MGRHGENIHKRKIDGRWEGRCLYFDKKLGRNRYHYVYGSTYDEAKNKKEAFQRRMETKQDICAESHSAAMSMLLSDVAAEWLMKVRKLKKPSTYVKYSGTYHKYIEGCVTGALLTDLKESYVKEKIFDHLSEEGKPLSYSIKKSIYCVLSQTLKYASDKYCMDLPALKKPDAAGHKKPVETFSLSEQSALFGRLEYDDSPYKAAVLASLLTGMRLGEVCALKWSDIDFDHGTVRVERTVQRLASEGGSAKTKLVITEPKSGFSRREIPVSKEVTEMLGKLSNKGEYLFRGDRPLEPRTLQGYFRRLLNKAGIEGRNFHTLRHTFATNCIENGMDAKCLSEILGHSSVNITLNRYVHPSMALKRSHMENIGKFYGQIRCQAA